MTKSSDRAYAQAFREWASDGSQEWRDNHPAENWVPDRAREIDAAAPEGAQAGPVAYLVGTPMNDKVLGLSIPNDGSHIKLKVNERMDLYTAADYDALRAEVENLRALEASLRGRAMAEHVRAEAAEAKVATVRAAASKLVEKAQQHNNVISTVFTKHLDSLDAALNEGEG